MIPFASQRGGGNDLATHLQNEAENEQVEVAHIRGAVAHDLHGAFAEWELQADCLTKCQNYLYSLSINPWDKINGPMSRDQYMDYIGRVEDSLGLADQPRAVVFHHKNGREHAHVVWSRIDADEGKAIQMSFDHQKLMMVTREFARDHDLVLPDGYEQSHAEKQKNRQNSLYDQHQQNNTGRTKEERMAEVTQAWRSADGPQGFVNALADMGYVLATGNRPYVLVDLHGHMSALPRMIDDKSVRSKDVVAFLEKDYPASALPTVDEAREAAARYRDQLTQHMDYEAWAAKADALKQAHLERRKSLEAEKAGLAERMAKEKAALAQKQAVEAKRLEEAVAKHEQAVAEKRAQFNPKGLMAFLGRASGAMFVRRVLHDYQDKKRHAGQADDREALAFVHQEEQCLQEKKHAALERDIERRLRNLEKVEAREFAALDQKFERARHQGLRRELNRTNIDSLSEHFRDAAGQVRGGHEGDGNAGHDIPDLTHDFDRASGADQDDGDGDGGDERDHHPRSEEHMRNRSRKKDQDRGRDR